MKIKFTVFIVITFVALSIIALAQSKISNSKIHEKEIEECGDKIGNFVLCIKAEKSEYSLKELVVLQISLKNISNGKVQLVRSI